MFFFFFSCLFQVFFFSYSYFVYLHFFSIFMRFFFIKISFKFRRKKLRRNWDFLAKVKWDFFGYWKSHFKFRPKKVTSEIAPLLLQCTFSFGFVFWTVKVIEIQENSVFCYCLNLCQWSIASSIHIIFQISILLSCCKISNSSWIIKDHC